MRPAIVLLLLVALVAPSPLAAAAECVEQGCADAWSADDGSCTAGGSERNVVTANTSTVGPPRRPAPNVSYNATFVHVETFCVGSGQDEYREARIVYRTDDRVDRNETTVLWSYDGATCRLDMQKRLPEEEAKDAEVTPIGCPRNTPPPRVPPLLP